jgi:hypothetical protein
MGNPVYAAGKHALGICDRCGFTHKLNDLKAEFTKQVPNGLRVCDQCMDEDHPQLMQGVRPVYDPQALRNARPDKNVDEGRTITGTVVYPPINGAEYGAGE